MADFFPKPGSAYVPVGSLAPSDYNVPQIELPNVGDTMLIAAFPFSYKIVGDGSQIPQGTNIIEVEVKALKKGKIITE